MWVLNYDVVVLNAFYAKQTGSLSKKDVSKLFQMIYGKMYHAHIPCLVGDEEGDERKIFGVRYISTIDDFYLVNMITKEKIDEINSIYSEEIQKLIVEAREEFRNMDLNKSSTRRRKN